MSFPSLLMEQKEGSGHRVIQNIELVWDNPGDAMPEWMNRDSYTVTRELRPKNVSQQVPRRHQNMAFDQYRFIHVWIGHADVLTSSIVEVPGGTFDPVATTNCELIKRAIFYLPGTGGVEFFYSTPDVKDRTSPSKSQTIGKAVQTPESWIYAIDGAIEKDIPYWIVKGIDIMDNNNSTSRVTFTFTFTTAWYSVEQVVDATV